MARVGTSTFIAACAIAVLSGCGRQDEQPQKGVDTTLPENPGKLTGNLSFPSDQLPGDLKVCAEAVEGGKQFCNAQINSGSYVLAVPAGDYRVFAQTAAMPGKRAYYSDFVECGYNSWCTSHNPITVSVEEGQTREGVNPGDWFVGQAPSPSELSEAAPENEVDQTGDTEPAADDLNENSSPAPGEDAQE